ncbi:hypothetical protein B2J88_10080 [Rhodococcus sp. SRB_17]|uniref:DNA-binding protein n=1 Tax=Acidovorax sp. SRB_24 TaxID=1962700 RepID=UPI00145CD50E|nr:DNA-binding protein [Acidovorax sp. SRB_24]NMM77060.1 hypothetical protein [Acidovorax sp. SRB_24]NMM84708.1 hypothetical protein [Rhodococcus sp. SRB_17]
MQHRISRGIQYEDVAEAADALLHDGLRPTIERIRQRIGRGSPNTVSPMLEQWFSDLGQRLGGGRAGVESALPHAVAQAATALWSAACSEAETRAAASWQAQQAAVTEAAEQLAAARAELDARELAMNERLHAAEAAMQLCSQQLAESNERWRAGERALALRDAEISAQRSAAARQAEQYAALQARLDTAQAQALDERTRQEAHYRTSERRWLEEVDRARQEARKSTLSAQDESRKLAVAQQQLESALSTHQAYALEQEHKIQQLHQDLASAQRELAHGQRLLAVLQSDGLKAKEAPSPRRLYRTPAPRRKLVKRRP